MESVNFKERYGKVCQDYPDAGDRFEDTVKAVYTAVLKPGSVAMDCGAHVGKHTLPLGRIVGPTGQVYAFEPILEKFERLTDNIAHHGLTWVQAFNVCCLDENKTVTFTYMPTDPGKSSIHVRKGLEHKPIEKIRTLCLAIRLDDFFSGAPPEFMKIDTEGAELGVLRGARALIEKGKPILHLEIGEPSCEAFGYRPDAIYSLVRDAGYEMFDILGLPIETIERFNESSSAPGIYDYIAIAEGDPRKETALEACHQMWRL